MDWWRAKYKYTGSKLHAFNNVEQNKLLRDRAVRRLNRIAGDEPSPSGGAAAADDVWFRGTNGFRVAWCVLFNKSRFSWDEMPAMRVGDENKGYLSKGISMTSKKKDAEGYAHQSSQYTLPQFSTCEKWLELPNELKEQRAQEAFNSGKKEHEETNKLLWAILMIAGRYSESEIEIMSDRRTIKLQPAKLPRVIQRCDEFCREITTKLKPAQYDAIKIFSTLGVIVTGRPDGKEYGGGGFLDKEIRREFMDIKSVEVVKVEDPADERAFNKMFPSLVRIAGDEPSPSGGAAAAAPTVSHHAFQITRRQQQGEKTTPSNETAILCLTTRRIDLKKLKDAVRSMPGFKFIDTYPVHVYTDKKSKTNCRFGNQNTVIKPYHKPAYSNTLNTTCFDIIIIDNSYKDAFVGSAKWKSAISQQLKINGVAWVFDTLSRHATPVSFCKDPASASFVDMCM